MADNQYEKFAIFSQKRLKKIYPDANVFFLDLGLSPVAREWLKSNQATLIRIEDLLDFAPRPVSRWVRRKWILQKILLNRKWPHKTIRKLLISDRRFYFEDLCLFKSACMRYILDRMECDDYLIYVDSDMVFLDQIDQISDNDVFVTLRNKEDISLQSGNVMILNSGIVGVRASSFGKDFLDNWVQNITECKENNYEQTALSSTVWGVKFGEVESQELSSFIDGFADRLEFQDHIRYGKIGIGACRVYNYYSTKIVPNVLPKVVHFKGGMRNFSQLSSDLKEWNIDFQEILNIV